MIKRLAIIPARGGSKRIKNKNIVKFLGKPLIYYAIDSLKESKLFETIHISTDSAKIKKIVKNKNINIDFFRPKYLSGDKIGVQKVIDFVFKKLKKKNLLFDEVWLIFATNPFISKKILIKASKLYQKYKGKYSILPVSKYNYPIEWALKTKKNYLLEPVFKNQIKKNSNKFKQKYCDAGMFVVYERDFLNKKIHRFKPLIIPYTETVDIDNFEDFDLAKKLFKKND